MAVVGRESITVSNRNIFVEERVVEIVPQISWRDSYHAFAFKCVGTGFDLFNIYKMHM